MPELAIFRGRRLLSGLLFRASRNDLVDPIVRVTFAHLSRFLPIRRVTDTDMSVVFYHPRPSWSTHVLIVPKIGIPSLLEATPTQLPALREVFRQARIAAERVCTGSSARSLIINGGHYQDVGQLHAHLICGHDVTPYPPVASQLPSGDVIDVTPHPAPRRPVHYMLRLAVPAGAVRDSYLPSEAQIGLLLDEVRALVERLDLYQRGFSLIASSEGDRLDYSSFHLVSG
jgi:histidine triad (HIT) family protein